MATFPSSLRRTRPPLWRPLQRQSRQVPPTPTLVLSQVPSLPSLLSSVLRPSSLCADADATSKWQQAMRWSRRMTPIMGMLLHKCVTCSTRTAWPRSSPTGEAGTRNAISEPWPPPRKGVPHMYPSSSRLSPDHPRPSQPLPCHLTDAAVQAGVRDAVCRHLRCTSIHAGTILGTLPRPKTHIALCLQLMSIGSWI
jgi:hypothetical protein